MTGYDCDGVLVPLRVPKPQPPAVIITGRTHGEWSRTLAEVGCYGVPIYMRPYGKHGDVTLAATWKAEMISKLGVTEYFEDDPIQIEIIRRMCPMCKIIEVAR